MVKFFKKIFNPKNKDLRNKILFTFAALFIFKLGTMIPVPGTKGITSDLGFLELLDMMGGGALKQFSIFAVGVMPYISASIIIQLLQMDIIPYLTELGKQGYVGRQKINQITRYVGIIMAFVQGYIISFGFLGSDQSAMKYISVAIILTAGTAFLLWLGDQITQKGVGNGISLIIMAGIISAIPNMFITAFKGIVDLSTTQTSVLTILLFAVFVLIYILVIVGVVFEQTAERRIPIQYANRTSSSYGSKGTYMPLKLNSAGVIPVIFASTVIAIPAVLAQIIKSEGFTLFVSKYLNYNSPVGFILYIALIVFFTYFYTFLQLKPNELSKNLKENGGYIPGIRPGDDTTKYFKQVLSRLTIIGAFFLVLITGLPIIFTNLSKLPTTVTIGGTGLLIVVGVALETYKQIESTLVSRSYKRGYRH